MTTCKTEAEARGYPAPTDRPQIELWHAGQKGFGVRIMRKNSRTGEVLRVWLLRDKSAKPEKKRIGTVGLMSMDQAWDIVRKQQREARIIKDTGRPPVPTLGEAFEAYKQQKSAKLSEATVEDYDRKMKYLRQWWDTPLNELAEDQWVTLYTDLIRRSGTTTARMVARTVRAIYNWNVAKKLVQDNPVTVLKEQGAFDKATPRHDMIPASKLKDFWHFVGNHVHPIVRDYIWCALLTGLRQSTMNQLRWSQLDMQKREYEIVAHERGNKSKQTVHFPIPDWLFEHVFLPRYRAKGPNDVWVFPSPKLLGQPLVSIRGTLAAWEARQGVHVSMHPIRRTFGTVAFKVLKDTLLVGRLLTHSVGKPAPEALVTSGYIVTDKGELRAAINEVANFIVEFVAA